MLVKGGLVIPYTVMMIFVAQKRIISFGRIEVVTMGLIVPSCVWFVVAIIKISADANNCRKHALFLFAVDFLMFMEALLFFSKLFIVFIVLSWSV
mmetsp:Transcript_21757/g.19271  ORF Transcript_21757/g.19271 Transcript_21757/m.19271 type:complete len:95 (+) Transcript_21757:278-562(+)